MKRVIETVGYFLAVTLSLVFGHVFLIAITSGGSVTIAVDQFGEMYPEFVLWLVMTPLIMLGLAYHLERRQPES